MEIGWTPSDEPQVIDLSQTSELFRFAVLATDRSMVIAEATREGALVFVNAAFERLSGYSSHEVVGKNLGFLQGPQTDPDVVEQLRTAFADLRPATMTMVNYRKDGSSFWNEVSLSPVYDDDGEVRHLVGVHTDVTVKVLAQRDLEAVYASERMAHSVARSANSRLEAILSQMPAGVLIAAAPSGRLLRGNAEMERIFRHPFIAADDVTQYDRYAAFHEDGERYRFDEWPLARALKGEVVTDEEIVIQRGDGTSGIILVRAAPINDEDANVVAAIAVFEDITERKRAERQLARERERSWALAATLQKSLLPPALPDVPGFDFGAAYTPVAEGLDVGGDFYDVFTQRDGSWVVVIGDVMGKGVEAVGVTSLARHALRTAGLRSRRPSTLLGILNQALLREGEGRPFCTVAAAVLSPEGDSVHLSLALGGHPRPIVMRASGEVQPVGEPGTLMGVLEAVDIYDVDLTLVEGDAIVMYTDGVSEARRDGRFFGEEGLRRTLDELAKRDLPAAVIAESIQHGVEDFLGTALKDDLAVLVVKVV